MSEPSRPAPSPWLLFGVSLVSAFVVPTVGIAVSAGRHDARAEAMERRQDKAELRIESISQQQSLASRETGELKVELQSVGREMTRLANAVERLAPPK